jgi:hypothetical protein
MLSRIQSTTKHSQRGRNFGKPMVGSMAIIYAPRQFITGSGSNRREAFDGQGPNVIGNERAAT